MHDNLLSTARVRSMLPVSKHLLDDALEIQADVMERISSAVVKANTRLIGLKESLAKTEARLLEDAREAGVKLTVDQAQAKVRRDPGRDRVWSEWMQAREEHEEWVGLLECWRQRGFSIRELAGLYASKYYSLDVTAQRPRSREDRSALTEQLAGSREALRGASRQAEQAVKTKRRTLL